MGVSEAAIGPQYIPDDGFKAAARLHQSRYRAEVLRVAYDTYGNRLSDKDAECLLNYFDGLGARETLRARFPSYKQTRDADMLRSEHIPFNLIAPLSVDRNLAVGILNAAFDLSCVQVLDIHIEYAPVPKEDYLNDGTSFDAYVLGVDGSGATFGLGIEVKYTEHGYPLGTRERASIDDPNSPYWTVSRESGAFINPRDPMLVTDNLRQIWRNHLLGLSMLKPRNGNPAIEYFKSVMLFPNGNTHFHEALPAYGNLLSDAGKKAFGWCTFEKYIAAISGSPAFDAWKAWLYRRYIGLGDRGSRLIG